MTRAGLLVLMLAAVVGCQDTDPGLPEASVTSGAVEPNQPSSDSVQKQAWFGELHVHTAWSLDAYLGGTRLSPSDAYRFARGEKVEVNGLSRQLSRPLDFAAVTDHAEYLGEMQAVQVEGTEGFDHPRLAELRTLTDYEDRERWFIKYVISNNRSGKPAHTDFYPGNAVAKSGWQTVIQAAEAHYEPGVFTTLAAFEWSAAPGGANLHRNVIFRDMVLPDLPISAVDTGDEEKLWQWMAAQEEQGSTLLAIPHNANASKGRMYESVDNQGKPLSIGYSTTRSRWEPLMEIMQVKGNSEVHRQFWPLDEFADFENADSIQENSGRTFRPENFVRWGLIKGLAYQDSLGVNPYQHGIVGGTDNHNGTPADVAEAGFEGSHGSADGTVDQRRRANIAGWISGRETSPGALTGVWATENTRESIFDALKTREVFATSGPRIRVRFYGGVGLGQQDLDELEAGEFIQGVPMGGELSSLDAPPVFLVDALQDPEGASLDRIQLIKGWIGPDGGPKEKIINLVWSGDRKKDESGRLPRLPGTVDLKTGLFDAAAGSARLQGVWTDVDFDPEQPAVYYVRVLEIETPRWTTLDAIHHGQPLLEDVPAVIQERAWTSPIWYTP